MGNKTEPNIIVEVVGNVPIPIRTAHVPSIIRPRAAAQFSAWPCNKRHLAADCFYEAGDSHLSSCGFLPAAQQFANFGEHGGYVLILAARNRSQIARQA